MPVVSFTSNLKRFFPDLKETTVRNRVISDIVEEVNEIYPGIKDYIVDDQGSLRKHVNVFIGNEMIADKQKLTDKAEDSSSVYFMQALSGG